jgi:diguanylate cyclase (GGDEF)-like protein
MIPDFYGLATQITALEATLSDRKSEMGVTESLSLAPRLAELAWYLRQRDTKRAIGLADECESLLSRAKAESRLPMVVGRLSLVRGEAARLFSRFDEALYYLSTGHDNFKLVSDADGLGDALVLMAGVHGDRGQLDQQRTYLAQALSAYQVNQDPLRLAFVQTACGLSGSIAAPDEALPAALNAEAFDGSATHPALIAADLARRAYAAFGNGQARKAATLACQALPLCQEGGRLRLAIAMAALAAESYAVLYDGMQATTWMEQSLSLAQENQWPWGLAVSVVRSAWVLHRLTLPDAALDLLAEAESSIALLGESRITALANCAHGDALLALGKQAEASTYYTAALRWSERRGDKTIGHRALNGQARACLTDGDVAPGLRLAQEALALADVIDSPMAQLETFDVLLGLATSDNKKAKIEADPWVLRAYALIDAHQEITPPPALLTALAHHAAEQQDMQRAYTLERRSTEIRRRLEVGRTRGRAATLSARRRSEQAQTEVDALRHTADMESARADALSRMVHTLERLSSVGQDILANLDSGGILSTLSRCGKQILGKDSTFTVYHADSPDGPLVILGSQENSSVGPCELDLRSDEDGELTAALVKVQRQRFEMVMSSPEGVRNGMILTPLISGDSCRGVLQITCRTALDEHGRAIARSLALFTSNALVNAERTEALAEINATLERIANYDVLTDIPNRRHFTETAAIELKRAQRHHRPLAVLMMDIDYFKKVNDTYGHAAGDAVLRDVAKALSSTLRPGDMVGRLGGEEFAALLPDCDQMAASVTAERLRAIVEGVRIAHDDQTLQVTISIGVSAVHPRDTSIEQPLQRADEGLYAAKRNGRNRVEQIF